MLTKFFDIVPAITKFLPVIFTLHPVYINDYHVGCNYFGRSKIMFINTKSLTKRKFFALKFSTDETKAIGWVTITPCGTI